MSATPIPRTLEMAVTGIREMSTLATPPEERQPHGAHVSPAPHLMTDPDVFDVFGEDDAA